MIERSGPCSCGVGLDDGDDLHRHSIQCAAGWASPEGARKVRCREDCEEEHRAALTRALTAQAWVSMCWYRWRGVDSLDDDGGILMPWGGFSDARMDLLANLPAPADLAEELLR